MKGNFQICTNIGTILTIAGMVVFGGATFAYADDEATQNQEVVSSPENTSSFLIGSTTDRPQISHSTPLQVAGAEEVPKTPLTDSSTVITDQSTESIQPTEQRDSGMSTDQAQPRGYNIAGQIIQSELTRSGVGTPNTSESTPTTTTQESEPNSSTSTESVGETTTEIWWAMPAPGNPNNVTWPQTLADPENLQCGVWYQVDTYLEAEAGNYTADGVLNEYEDWPTETQRGSISWYFNYGGECEPDPGPKPDPWTEILDNHFTTDCQAGFITHVLTKVVHDYQIGPDGTWVEVVGEPITAYETSTPTTEQCPPQATPKQVPTPAATPAQVTEQPHPTHVTDKTQLAETGSRTADYWPVAIALAALLIIAGAVVVILGHGRLKRSK